MMDILITCNDKPIDTGAGNMFYKQGDLPLPGELIYYKSGQSKKCLYKVISRVFYIARESKNYFDQKIEIKCEVVEN